MMGKVQNPSNLECYTPVRTVQNLLVFDILSNSLIISRPVIRYGARGSIVG
jgi:hypothetical protein